MRSCFRCQLVVGWVGLGTTVQAWLGEWVGLGTTVQAWLGRGQHMQGATSASTFKKARDVNRRNIRHRNCHRDN